MTSKEEENFLRIVYLHYRVVTPCLTKFFDGIHPDLSTSVNLPANKTVLFNLNAPGRKKILNKDQWNTLFPPPGSTPVTSAELDLTLMVCLLRNISPVVKPPVKGFDELPPVSELNHGAHLARIKYYKNYLVSHSTDGRINDSDFTLIWSDLERALKGLGNAQDVADAYLAKSRVLDSSNSILLSTELQVDIKVSNLQDQLDILKCKQEVLQTKYTCFEDILEVTETNSQKMHDESHGNYHETIIRIESLEQDIAELKRYRNIISQQYIGLKESFKTDFEEFAKSTCNKIHTCIAALDMKANYIVKLLENVKTSINSPEWMIIKTQKWKIAHKYFVKTRASDHVLECILYNQCVSIVGPSGVGKTFLLQHVALEMETKGFSIICVNDPSQLLKHYQSGRDTLFVIDDMCGNSTTVRVDEWKRSMKDITDIVEGSCKLILSCRLQVFQHEVFEHSDLKLFKTCVCNLIGKKLALTDAEKDKFVENYFKNTTTNPQLRLDVKCLYQYDCFPLLCKLYDTNKDQCSFRMKTFLKAPFSFYETKLNDFYVDCKKSKYKFIALLLLVVFNNHLDQNMSKRRDDGIKQLVNEIREQCGINGYLTIKSLILELDTMIGTFVLNEDGFYKTIHDKLFDFLAHYFGTYNNITRTAFTELLIKRAENSFIGERFIIANSGKPHYEEFSYAIFIQDEYLLLYIWRVFYDMTKSDDIAKYLETNRNIFNEPLKTKLKTFMKQLDKDKQNMLIQNASFGFLRDVFVMNEGDMKTSDNTTSFHFGIILEPAQLQKYIQKFFYGMTKSHNVKDYIQLCRCCSNELFISELQTYMTNLKPTRIRDLIENASTSFVQNMFVITKENIWQSSPRLYERYGIKIPCDLLHVYIERFFDRVTMCPLVDICIQKNRNRHNALFHNKLRTYMSQFDRLKTNKIIEFANQDCIDKLCVINDTRKVNSQLEVEHYDVFSPKVYTKTYSYSYIKTRQRNKQSDSEPQEKVNKHVRKIMTVMETLWERERYGFIIPRDSVPLYVRRWFNGMKKSTDINNYFNNNRNTGTNTFQKALLKLMVQLEEDEIKTLIHTATNDFLHKMFVTTQEDIKQGSNKLYQNYGIVLPKHFWEIYTDRILILIKCPDSFVIDMNCNRNIKTVLKYMSHLDTFKIVKLLDTANDDFFHRMITVDVEDKLPLWREIADWPYHDYDMRTVIDITTIMKKSLSEFARGKSKPMTDNFMFNHKTSEERREIADRPDFDFYMKERYKTTEEYIVCPVSLINSYMDRMVSDWGRGKLKLMINNINLKNKTFVEKYVRHLNCLKPSKILELLYIRNFRCKHEATRNDTALTVSCVNEVVDLAKWCFENHLYANTYKKRHALCAMFLLVVFNNHLEVNVLNDNSTKVNAVILLFRERHNIFEAISAESIKEKLDTCFNGMIFIKEGVFAVKHSAVFQFLVYYFTSIIDMTHILIENANGIMLCKHFLEEKKQQTNFIINLDAKQLHRCTERIFEEMTKSENCLRYMLSKDKNVNVQQIIDNMRHVNKVEIKTTINNFSNVFFNKILCITYDATEQNKDAEPEPYIVVPDDAIPVYINSFFKRVTKIDCVALCFQENRNRDKTMFRNRLSIYMNTKNKDDVEMLIKHASRNFICTMLVMSEKDIKTTSHWEYECYGIVIPEDCYQIYIERVFGDLTECDNVHFNRNSGNQQFRQLLHSYTSSICETTILALIQTASSKCISRIKLSTENYIRSQRWEYFAIFINEKYYQTFKQHWPKGNKFIDGCQNVYSLNVIDEGFGISTLISRTEANYECVRITVKRNNELIIDDLQWHALGYIDPILTSNKMEYSLITPDNLVAPYMQRMIVDWMNGKVHDVLGNINLNSQSFLERFITYLRNTEKATQIKLADMDDNITGDSPLRVCCLFGISQLVEWCLDNLSYTDDRNETDDERPLYIACKQNYFDVVLILLQHKRSYNVNVNVASRIYDYNLMCKTGSSGHSKIVTKLLEKGKMGHSSDGIIILETPLFVACKYGHTEIVSILLTEKKDEILIHGGRRCIDIPLLQETMTPLYIACKKGYVQIVSLLLNHAGSDFDVNKPTDKMETQLFAACENGFRNIVSLLLVHTDLELNRCKIDGSTPLFAACREGHVDVVCTLLNSKDIAIDQVTCTGMSPLFIASLLGHYKIVEMLLSRNADPNILAQSKETMKKRFAEFETCHTWPKEEIQFFKTYIEYLRTFIVKNASDRVNSYIDKMGETWVLNLIARSSPLHIASAMGHTEIVKLLDNHMPRSDFFNDNCCTPLFLACELGHDDVVRVLLSNGANAMSNNSKSPLTIAIKNGHMQITIFILERCR